MISFWHFPTSIDFEIGGSTSTPSATYVQNQDDDFSNPYQWSPLQKKAWSYTGYCGGSVPEHGAITLVKFYAKMWRSAAGADNWDYGPGNPCVMAFVDFGKNFSYGRSDCVPDPTENLHSHGADSRWGGKLIVSQFWNYATNPGGPDDAGDVLGWEVDVTSKASWDDALLDGIALRVEASERTMGSEGGYEVEAGHSAYTGSANSPRFNISQLGLYVEADDPPIPYASGGSLVVV